MRIQELFKLNGVSFLNVDTEKDTPLYIDPIMLRVSENDFAKICLAKVDSFRGVVSSALEKGSYSDLMYLFSHMGEENATRLGVGMRWGKAIGPERAKNLVEAIMASSAVRNGLVSELVDMNLFVNNIGPDCVSDMITNITKGELASFTQRECQSLDIPMSLFDMGFCWDSDLKDWVQLKTYLPVDEKGDPLLFVPNVFVSDYRKYTASRFFNLTILDSKLTQEVNSKKELRRLGYRYNLDFVIEESLLDLDLLKKFKERVVTECKEMLHTYGTHDAVFCFNFRLKKSVLRLKVFQSAISGLKSVAGTGLRVIKEALAKVNLKTS